MPDQNLPHPPKFPAESSDDEPGELFADGPPCLQRLISINAWRGDDRELLVRNGAFYLEKKAGGADHFKTDVHIFNRTCREPLPYDKVEAVIKSMSRRRTPKSYTCSES